MKVLITGPIGGGSLAMARAIAAAFAGLGCDSAFIDNVIFLDAFDAATKSGNTDRMRVLIRSLEKVLINEINRFKPDVLLGMAQSPVFHGPFYDDLRKSGVITAYWFIEDFRVETYWKQIARHFDIFFSIQKDAFAQALSEIGSNNHYYLPIAFDNNMDMPPVQSGPRMPLSFMGSPHPNRVRAFKLLSSFNPKIFGGGWHRHPINGVVGGERAVSISEARSIYLNTDINLNLHSSYDPDVFRGDFVNPRTFELAGLGCFQLTDRRECMPELYSENEIVQFDDLLELAKLIKYYSGNESERHEIARNAQRRTLRNHLYEHRALEIIHAVRRL